MMKTNTKYLNKSTRWSPRGAFRPRFFVWHETASRSDDPEATLTWSLTSQASYNDLIAKDGTRWPFLSWDRAGWHAGAYDDDTSAELTLDGVRYVGLEINQASLGIEVDSPADGTPATPQQKETIVELMLLGYHTYGIPLERKYHLRHAELTAPSYRSDPRGYDVNALLAKARARLNAQSDNPQVLALPGGPLPISRAAWLRSFARHQADQRGLSVDAQNWLYNQCERLRVHPAFVIGMLLLETRQGRQGAAPLANNWLNVRELDSRAWSVTIGAIDYERWGTPELNIESQLAEWAGRYAYQGRVHLRDVLELWLSPHPEDGDLLERAVRQVLETMRYVAAN